MALSYGPSEDFEGIAAFLRGDPGRHVYALGDLDPFFRPRTRWWTAAEGAEIRSVVMLYSGLHTQTVLALGEDVAPLRDLVRHIGPQLPDRAYLHVEPGVEEAFDTYDALVATGEHARMVCTQPEFVPDAVDERIEWLSAGADAEVRAFYAEAYPDNWFDPRMLETGRYAAVREGGRLVAVAGVHVWSAKMAVAALGNIATTPSARGRGLGRRVTAAVTRALLADGCSIGLNVAASNAPAIRLYRSLGFTRWSSVSEFSASRSVRA